MGMVPCCYTLSWRTQLADTRRYAVQRCTHPASDPPTHRRCRARAMGNHWWGWRRSTDLIMSLQHTQWHSVTADVNLSTTVQGAQLTRR